MASYGHVKLLRTALGSAVVPRPNIDFTNALNAIAPAISIAPATPITAFNWFCTFQNFLMGAFTFEDVGVTASHGAAAALFAGRPYLTPSAQIVAVEAYHSATLHTLILATVPPPSNASPVNSIPPNTLYLSYANGISNVRASLGGGNKTPLTIDIMYGERTRPAPCLLWKR